MQVMFSNTDEELANQVDNDIKSAKENGVVDTDEVKYEHVGNGNVAITDKENGEVTIAQAAADEADTYDLIAVPDGQLEKFLHPSVGESVQEGNQVGAPDEKVDNHFGSESVIAPNQPDGGRNDEAGHEKSVEDTAKEGPAAEGESCPECGKTPCECKKEEEEREFSVSTDNTVVQRIFSDQIFCERLFSEVIESEETTKVGALKVEKVADEDNAVVVTDTTTGDQAKVELNGEEMNVTELDSKAFSEEEQFMPLFVVGVDAVDHVIVDAQEWSQESAEDLARQLTEDGVDAVQIFETQEEARDYAIELLNNLGVEDAEDVDEPVQQEYSDHGEIWFTTYRDNNTNYMCRMFSEVAAGIANMQDAVSDAISNGDQIETDNEIITPVDAINAVIEDKNTGETTKATLNGEDVKLQKISEEEAKEIKGNVSVIESESNETETKKAGTPSEDEKEFSENAQWYTNEAETRLFSEGEEMTDYMQRIFSEESDQDAIETAIAGGEPVETETETITPIDDKTAIVEDKANGEFTKATILDEDAINLHPISEEEVDNLVEPEDAPNKETENAAAEEEGEQKNYSELYDWTNEAETRFYSEGEEMTDYMIRLFSEEADQNEIESAIESGEQIENDDEVITPVDDKTAIVEDKANGEFTKAVIKNDDEIEVNKISEEEADKLTDGLQVEDKDEDEDEDDEEKKFSDPLSKFFAEINAQANQVEIIPAVVDPATGQLVPAEQKAKESAPTVEEAEDKAEAAIQSIQAAAAEAAAQIAEAKAAPVVSAEPDLQEATFSETNGTRPVSQRNLNSDTLVSWLGGIK